MSDTPRTDDAVGECVHYEALCDMVEAEFARTLERENAAMREAIKEAHEAIVLSPYPDADALSKLQPFLKP